MSRLPHLHKHLFPDDSLATFAVLDAARIPGLPDRLAESDAPSVSVITGPLKGHLDEVAPYLVQLERDDPLCDWILTEGWGKRWGIFARAPGDLRGMRRHFRTFLTVRLPDNSPAHFRYYDPRILRVYLPTCTRAERRTIYGPVARYLIEDGDQDHALVFGGFEHSEPQRVSVASNGS